MSIPQDASTPESDRLTQAVISYWRAGYDTWQIARALRSDEPTVCRILQAWRDLRWQMRRAQA